MNGCDPSCHLRFGTRFRLLPWSSREHAIGSEFGPRRSAKALVRGPAAAARKSTNHAIGMVAAGVKRPPLHPPTQARRNHGDAVRADRRRTNTAGLLKVEVPGLTSSRTFGVEPTRVSRMPPHRREASANIRSCGSNSVTCRPGSTPHPAGHPARRMPPCAPDRCANDCAFSCGRAPCHMIQRKESGHHWKSRRGRAARRAVMRDVPGPDLGGEGGIRTRGRLLTFARFPGV